jgi:hypothetical protein
MNEDRLSQLSQNLETRFRKYDDFIGLKSTNDQTNSNEAATATDADYIEHSFGGVPIPKAPGRLGDLSGMIVTDHDEADNLLLGS